MSYPNENEQNEPMSNPAEQMQMADMLRYVQRGFEAPMLKSIASYGEHNNAWTEAIDEMEAFRSMAQHVLDTPAEDVDYVDEALLAAYFDGNVTEEEAATVKAHLAGSHGTYRQYAAVHQEMEHRVAPRFRAPAKALAQVKMDVQASVVEQSETVSLLDRLEAWLRPFFAPRWAMPAYSFALGVLVMMLVLMPTSPETVVFIPTMMAEEASEGVTFSVDGEAVAPSVMVLPATGDLKLTWQAIDGIGSYRVEIYDANNERVFEAADITTNQVTLDESVASAEATYTLSVIGSYTEGGVLPVTTMTFKRMAMELP